MTTPEVKPIVIQDKEVNKKYEITQVGDIKDELQVFISDYSNLVVTPETYNESKKARATIREKRFFLQNILKKNNDTLNTIKKDQKEKFDEFINILLPVEEKIHEGIKAIEEKKKAEKEEKDRRERERVENIRKAIDNFQNSTWEALLSCDTVEKAEKLLEEAESFDDSFDTNNEFMTEAQEKKAALVEKVKNKLEALKAQEDLRKEDERVAAIKKRISTFKRGFAEKIENATKPEELDSIHSNLKDYKEDFEDYNEEAETARKNLFENIESRKNYLIEKAEIAKKKAEQDAKDAELRKKQEAIEKKEEEQRKKDEAEAAKQAAKEKAKRAKALKPIKQKIVDFAESLIDLGYPQFEEGSQEFELISEASHKIIQVAKELKAGVEKL